MTGDARDELILRHLDGGTSDDEIAQVTGLLHDDDDFRLRFFNFANLIVDLQENLSLHGSVPAMLTLPVPKSVRVDKLAEELSGSIDFRRIYQNAVLGGLGGLLGWLLVSVFTRYVPIENTYLRDAIFGLLAGVCIGFAVGCTEGLLAARSLQRMLRGGGFGAGLGAAGGVIGLLIGEFILSKLGGGVLTRALGWGVFGMFVGVSDGVAQRMPVKIRYGILGGLLGGLIGGSTYDCLIAMFNRSEVALAWGSAIGLIILGACIGFLVSLVEALLRKSWLFFITGRLEGQTRTLDSSRPHTLGSDAGCTIIIPSDASVAAVHAEIFFDGEFQVRPRDGQVVVRRDGHDQTVSAPVVLAPGDRVLLGDTRMIFRNVEAKRP